MRRAVAVAAAIVIMALLLTGCGAQDRKTDASSDGKIKVVAMVFPAYDWTKQIAEGCGNVDVEYLLDTGVDMHSYQPSVSDIADISDCDVFIYAGGASSAWVKDALKEADNPDMKVVCMLDSIGSRAKYEERAEGMQEERGEGEEEEKTYDEHVWLSIRNAEMISKDIAGALEEADPGNAEKYSANLQSYTDKLQKLDKEYSDTVANSKRQTLLFGDRFPFRYLVDDYGISYYAAFAGCSAESEADFETIVFLADKVDSLKLPGIMITESGNRKIADTIIDNTKTKDQKVLKLDSMQSVRTKDIEKGETYISVMSKNLKIIKKALN